MLLQHAPRCLGLGNIDCVAFQNPDSTSLISFKKDVCQFKEPNRGGDILERLMTSSIPACQDSIDSSGYTPVDKEEKNNDKARISALDGTAIIER